jgi:beta-galactosidase
MVLAWDASFELFRPGQSVAQQQLIATMLQGIPLPYAAAGAVVYRLASPEADHYFFINDGPAKQVRLQTPAYRYRAAEDPVSQQRLELGAPIDLEAYSGRWLRLQK